FAVSTRPAARKAARFARRLFVFSGLRADRPPLMPLPPAPTKRAALLSPDAYQLKATEAGLDELDERSGGLNILDLDEPEPAQATQAAPAPRAKARRGSRPALEIPAPAPAPAPERARPAPAARNGRTEAPQPQAAPAPATAPVAAGSRRRGGKASMAGPARLFVLDTNVLLHDPMSLFRF